MIVLNFSLTQIVIGRFHPVSCYLFFLCFTSLIFVFLVLWICGRIEKENFVQKKGENIYTPSVMVCGKQCSFDIGFSEIIMSLSLGPILNKGPRLKQL